MGFGLHLNRQPLPLCQASSVDGKGWEAGQVWVAMMWWLMDRRRQSQSQVVLEKGVALKKSKEQEKIESS